MFGFQIQNIKDYQNVYNDFVLWDHPIIFVFIFIEKNHAIEGPP